MLYNILSMRAIQVGLAFFLLLVAGSLLYTWHVQHTTAAELAETQRRQQRYENHNAPRTAAAMDVSMDVSMETRAHGDLEMSPSANETQSISAETPRVASEDTQRLDFIDVFLGDAITSEAAEEPVDAPYGFSPYGFGPFPEVPTDYPRSAEAVWGEARLLTMRPEHELLSRVQIELWNQGVRTVGSVYNTDYDLIFPVLDHVVYIQRDFSAEAGEPYISSMLGSPATINQYEDALFEGNFPPHLTIYEYPDGGINPYEFLDVSR